MGIMTAIRSQLPVSIAPQQPAPTVAEPAHAIGTVRPVADQILADAVRQPNRSAATMGARLAEASNATPEEEGRKAASQAAQQAYIRASIAAGISPLPLP